MKAETIAKIRELMKFDVEDRRDRLLKMIEGGYNGGLELRIAEYREAFNALGDFEDFVDKWEEQNDA